MSGMTYREQDIRNSRPLCCRVKEKENAELSAENERLRAALEKLIRWAERGADAIPISCQQFWAKDIEQARAALEGENDG